MTSELLDDILRVSKRNNMRDGITGILMYHDNLFFQVIEGNQGGVEALWKRIQQDSRHGSVALMWSGEVAERSFSDWAMGFAGSDQISSYTNDRMVSLNELKSRKDSTSSINSLALLLATEVFQDFRGANRFSNARSE
jgi:hypothetical protein